VEGFDHLTLQWFDLSISDTAIGKKYYSAGPSMFNVPNKALITLFVIQFNVVKVIYISKVVGVEVQPQCGACLVEIWGRNPWLSPSVHSQIHTVQGGLTIYIYIYIYTYTYIV